MTFQYYINILEKSQVKIQKSRYNSIEGLMQMETTSKSNLQKFDKFNNDVR